jgi:hypothetical protein
VRFQFANPTVSGKSCCKPIFFLVLPLLLLSCTQPNSSAPAVSVPTLISPLDAEFQTVASPQVAACWGIDAGAPGVASFEFNLDVVVDATGTIREAHVSQTDQSELQDPIFAAYANRAIDAVLAPQCSKLQLPADMLGQAHVFSLNFASTSSVPEGPTEQTAPPEDNILSPALPEQSSIAAASSSPTKWLQVREVPNNEDPVSSTIDNVTSCGQAMKMLSGTPDERTLVIKARDNIWESLDTTAARVGAVQIMPYVTQVWPATEYYCGAVPQAGYVAILCLTYAKFHGSFGGLPN